MQHNTMCGFTVPGGETAQPPGGTVRKATHDAGIRFVIDDASIYGNAS